MNVLFIAGWYPNSTFIYQGIFVKKHAQALKSVGINVKVVAFTINKSNKILENYTKCLVDENGIETLLIEINSVFHKFFRLSVNWQYRFMKKKITSCFNNFKPDIIHSNVLFTAGILGHKLAANYKVPHVITEHWSKADAFIEKGLFSGIAKQVLASASQIMPVSSYLASKLDKFIPGNKITVVPNAVNTDIFRFRNTSNNEELVFGCLANWEPPKRPDLIFEGLEAYVKKSGKKIKLIAVGGGILIEPIKKQNWNFEVEFHGFVSSEEIINVFKDVKFLLHASENETFSIILAEAAIMGIPMVASNKGAMPELVNNENGILTENTIEAWVQAIEKITALKYNWKQLSDDMIKRTSYQNVGMAYKSVYEKALLAYLN